jgi:predicted lipoprotein with Yx(FWY)xxD motif
MITKSTAWLASMAVFIIFAAGCGTSGPIGNGCAASTYSIVASQVGACPNSSSAPGTTASNAPISASAAPISASAAPISASAAPVSASAAPVSASAAPVSSSPPVASAPMPLATATLLGSPGFVNASGFTVYVFDADLKQANASTCNTGCSGVWPPVTPPSGTLPANWTSFQRQDGTKQLAYKTRALYTYTGDTAAGNANGDGINAFGGIWHVARP